MEGIDINAPPAFDIGTRVTCPYGIYRCRKTKTGYVVPYQIQLDNLIYAPFDTEDCVRKSIVPAPDCWICFDNRNQKTT